MDNTKIQAKKYLGQNFLKNPDILNKIVGNDDLTDVHIIEVGPGPGDLTSMILSRAPKSLSLIEIDGDMIELLTSRFFRNRIDIYHADVLKMDVIRGGIDSDVVPNVRVLEKEKSIKRPAYHLYGNIPYYITSPIIHHFFYDTNLQPDVATFTMQKEVADRILARDGKHSVLSLHCQLRADIEKVCDINPNSFTPAPKVWSTCLRFDLREDENREVTRNLLTMIELGFSQKRKKLLSNLSQRYSKEALKKNFEQLHIDENVRAEDLEIDTWKKLFKNLT